MDTDQETELRAMASDLVLDWHNEIGAKGLDRATKADYEHLIEAAAVAPDGTWALLGSYLRPRAGQVVDDELLRLDLATGE